jgi:hypothetical protein
MLMCVVLHGSICRYLDLLEACLSVGMSASGHVLVLLSYILKTELCRVYGMESCVVLSALRPQAHQIMSYE